jgi:hypothetical protein
MDFLVTLFYLPAYLLGVGISIIIWYVILSFAIERIGEWVSIIRDKRRDTKYRYHDDDIDNYY